MGTYDTFRNLDGSVEIQSKAGPCESVGYIVNDFVGSGYPDGVFHHPDGWVIISGNQVFAVWSRNAPLPQAIESNGLGHLPHFDKWGNECRADISAQELNNRNPTQQAVTEVAEAYKQLGRARERKERARIEYEEACVVFSEANRACLQVNEKYRS